ncbi:MAG: ABC transporter ATP-binding protein [Proteobacteria bacterium]|nr:ABC transporter ATP-binding protein [Pseudomonadota bacterium]
MDNGAIIEVRGLHKEYRVKGNVIRAVSGVDLAVQAGETFAIVGESGSGKTTLANLILGIERPSRGEILFRGEVLGRKMSKDTRRRIQVVQQNPVSALNPKRTIKKSIELPVSVHGLRPPKQRRERVAELMDVVGLSPDFMDRYPNALSGGQRQRAALARAMAAEPDVIVLDEPTSALDVSVQAKVLGLLMDLQSKFNLTYIFITHDLSVVRNVSDRIAVMYRGRFVETGRTEVVFAAPRHRYTNMLLSSVPVVSEEEEAVKPEWPWEQTMEGSDQASDGCAFSPRCPYAQDNCWAAQPGLEEVGEVHFMACYYPANGAGDARNDAPPRTRKVPARRRAAAD